uniref:Putative secreted protein n=1 Tax=Ixodes ricinus TaxID=34613 RepID=A0A090XBK1_IXORI
MLAFLCVVAALLAPSDTKLTKEQREERQRKSTKNAWLVCELHSVDSDILLGASHIDAAMGCIVKVPLKCPRLRQGEVPHRWPQAYMWIKVNQSREEKDEVSMNFEYYYGGYKDYTLLFTDYQTCFTMKRDHDKALQVWMIGSTEATRINETCHSTYNETLNKTGHHLEIPRYYIYNETICGTK